MTEEQKDHMPFIFQFLNNIVKSALQVQGFKQIGRMPKFFLEVDKKRIDRHNLEMWPGYVTMTRLVNDGIFLNIDTCAKFLNKTTILETITNQRHQRGMSKNDIAEKYNSSNPEAQRVTVMMRHDSKTYQVDGLTWDKNPVSHKFESKPFNS